MPLQEKRTVYLNYHNLGFGPQVGINKINPIIFSDHVRLIRHTLLNDNNLEIVMTFDDGYENIYNYAYNELNNNSKIKKKIFIIKNYIGCQNSWDFSFSLNRYRHLNKKQIIKLSNNDWEIGSHGVTHRSFLSMDKVSAKEEIVSSKKYLEDLTGEAIKSIAPPFSDIDQWVYDVCVEAGYEYIFIQKKININTLKETKLILRNNVYSVDTNSNILNKIKSDKLEEMKENFISSFNNLTVIFSKLLTNSNLLTK